MKRLALMLALVLATPASAQFFQSVPDTSNLATKSDVASLQSTMPMPANAAPPMDGAVAQIGSQTQRYQLQDSVRPRITRSFTVQLAADGTATADWSTQPLPTTGKVVLTPRYTGSGAPKCWTTASATTTSVPIKCVIESGAIINLSIVTSGLTLNSAANGMFVDVIVLPASQGS